MALFIKFHLAFFPRRASKLKNSKKRASEKGQQEQKTQKFEFSA